MNLRRRVEALEDHFSRGRGAPRLWIVEGGLPDPDGLGPTTARSGPYSWQRRDGEPAEAFRGRVMAEATRAALPFVVLGGLPERTPQPRAEALS